MEEPPIKIFDDFVPSEKEYLDRYLVENGKEFATVSFRDFLGALENIPKKSMFGHISYAVED